MTLNLASPRTRLIVLVLHLALLVAGCVYAWEQWTAVAEQQAAVDEARGAVQDLDVRLAAAAAKKRSGVAAAPDADALIKAASATVAGAGLQGLVVAAVRNAGGNVTSSQIDLTGGDATPPVVVLNVNAQIANAALQGLLYGLETRTPALFLDQLSIEPAPPETGVADRVGADPLRISMAVSAFWKGPSKP